MKPGFALNLSHDGIGLLERTAEGWKLLGAVALDAPDLTDRLFALHALATGRSADGVPATKLIIPESQVLYTTVSAPGSRAEARRAITAALDGMTPYPVADLVFDWTGRGDAVQVAVVARETLREAEAFAEDWGFNPVSFVAAPGPGQYAGEPWFGQTEGVTAQLGAEERIDRDQDPVPLAAAYAVFEAQPAEPIQQAEPRPSEPAGPEVATETAPEPDIVEAEFTADSVTVPEEQGDISIDEAAGDAPIGISDDPEPHVTATPEPEENAEADPAPEPENPVSAASDIAEPTPLDDTPVAEPPVSDRPPPDVLTAELPATELQDPESSAEELPGPELRNEEIPVTETPDPEPPVPDTPAPETVEPVAATPSEAPEEAGEVLAALPAIAAVSGSAPRLGGATRTPASPAIQGPKAIRSDDLGSGGPAPAIRRPGIVSGKTARTTAPAQASKAGKEDDSPAPPGAGRIRRGKPRYLGIALVAGLIVVMSVVALWAALRDADGTTGAQPAPPQAETPATGDAALNDAFPLRDTRFAQAPLAGAGPLSMAADAALPPQSLIETDQTAEAAPEMLAVLPEPEPRIPAEDENSGAAPVLLAALSGAEAPPEPPFAQPLAATAMLDIAPERPAPPPSFTELTRLAANEATEPSASGTRLATGITLFSGRPPSIPGPRPAALSPAPEATAPAASTPEAPLPAGDPALAGVRPKARPATIAPAAPAPPPEIAEAPVASEAPAAQGPVSRPPAARPDSIAAAAAKVVPEAPAETAFDGASTQAVSVSRRPEARPRNYKTAVSQALASAIATEAVPVVAAVPAPPAPAPAAPAAATPRQQAAAPAAVAAAPRQQAAPPKAAEPEPAQPRVVQRQPDPTEELDEPEPTLPARSAPTTASVAKQATQKDALAMREMNLIGLYGAASNRRALVRMPNGRMIKVSIGDKLDGGRVTAIGDGQLTYQKGSKLYTLKLLQGS